MAGVLRSFRALPLLLCGVITSAAVLAQPVEFSFGVIGHPFRATTDESALREAIKQSDADNLAFVVANGIKAGTEPCTDKLYQRRKSLFNEAKNGIIVSLAASDWSGCKSASGRSAAIERLNQVRDLFFVEEFSFGASKIPLMRQSTTAKFRSYGENARWEIGDVMFATVNLPSNNNHYRTEAGRNSEFEDRQVANRDWLNRISALASRKKMGAIILFCDGNPLLNPGLLQRFEIGAKRDGFAEARRQLKALASKFPGAVLLIHNQTNDKRAPPNDGIVWQDNLGELAIGPRWTKVTVGPARPVRFAVSNVVPDTDNSTQ